MNETENNKILPFINTRICSYCGGVEFETMKTQYNDVDGDYDDCIIIYCIKCRHTVSL
jgi:hypothetical protein